MASEKPVDALGVARQYLHAITAGDRAALETLLAPDIVFRELPNRLNPHGSVRDRQAMLGAFDRGKTLLSAQRYEVERTVVQDRTVALEVAWTGTLAVPLGTLAAGDVMRARFAMFIDVDAGRVVRQSNYDCFDAF